MNKYQMTTKTKTLIAIALVALGVSIRLLPHLWNFTPIVAIALFAGYYLGKRWALGVTAAAMLIGDVFIGFYAWQVMIAVYGSFALVGPLGHWVAKIKGGKAIAATSIVSSTFFFLSTNFAVWAFTPMYDKTFTGLMSSYTLALPFFRNALLGDLFYTGALFGAFALANYLYKKGVTSSDFVAVSK